MLTRLCVVVRSHALRSGVQLPLAMALVSYLGGVKRELPSRAGVLPRIPSPSAGGARIFLRRLSPWLTQPWWPGWRCSFPADGCLFWSVGWIRVRPCVAGFETNLAITRRPAEERD